MPDCCITYCLAATAMSSFWSPATAIFARRIATTIGENRLCRRVIGKRVLAKRIHGQAENGAAAACQRLIGGNLIIENRAAEICSHCARQPELTRHLYHVYRRQNNFGDTRAAPGTARFWFS